MTDPEMIEVPAIAASDGEYVLRMRGDSLNEAGILDGDNLVVKAADTAEDGEIVVAKVGEEMTVTRWPAEFDGARVVGRVVGVFRSVNPMQEKDSHA